MNQMRARQSRLDRGTFAPEAYGEFPVVPTDSIAELRRLMDERTMGDEWETIEDVVAPRINA